MPKYPRNEASSSIKTTLARISPLVIIFGYLIWLSVFLLPVDFLTSFLGSFRWGGFATMILCPLFGIFGLLSALWTQQNKLVLSSIPLIFAALISMIVVSLLISLGF